MSVLQTWKAVHKNENKCERTAFGVRFELQTQMIPRIRQVRLDRKKNGEDCGELEIQAQPKSFKLKKKLKYKKFKHLDFLEPL